MSLEKELEQSMRRQGRRPIYSISKEAVESGIKYKLFSIESLNVPIGDGTYESTVLYKGETFHYIGSKVAV